MGDSVEVAIFQSEFERLLNLKALDKFSNTNEYKKTVVSLEVGFRDHKGKLFIDRSFKYFYFVGETVRNT